MGSTVGIQIVNTYKVKLHTNYMSFQYLSFWHIWRCPGTFYIHTGWESGMIACYFFQICLQLRYIHVQKCTFPLCRSHLLAWWTYVVTQAKRYSYANPIENIFRITKKCIGICNTTFILKIIKKYTLKMLCTKTKLKYFQKLSDSMSKCIKDGHKIGKRAWPAIKSI